MREDCLGPFVEGKRENQEYKYIRGLVRELKGKTYKVCHHPKNHLEEVVQEKNVWMTSFSEGFAENWSQDVLLL